jgi:beta-lactamase regulating signal transducer with metallopeptidase domain
MLRLIAPSAVMLALASTMSGGPQVLLQKQMARSCNSCQTFSAIADKVISASNDITNPTGDVKVLFRVVVGALLAILGLLIVVAIGMGTVKLMSGASGGVDLLTGALLVPLAVVVVFGVVL